MLGQCKRFTTKHRFADGFYTHVVLIDDDISFDIDTLDLRLKRLGLIILSYQQMQLMQE